MCAIECRLVKGLYQCKNNRFTRSIEQAALYQCEKEAQAAIEGRQHVLRVCEVNQSIVKEIENASR